MTSISPDPPAPRASGWTRPFTGATLPASRGAAVNRLRLVQIAALMLYAGPLFAGVAGYGWGMVWPFAAIFLLWQAVMRPADWPRDAAQWADPATVAGAVARVAILAIVVALCFGVGRGLGGAVGFVPDIPAIAPLAVSLLAVPLARLLWDPAKAAELDRMLDTAIRDVEGLAQDPSPDARHLAQATALATRMLEPLALMPEDTPDEAILAHLRAMGRQVDDARLRAALIARTADGPEMPMVLQRALMLHASDGRLMEILGGDNASRAFIALPDTPAVFETFANRMAGALNEDADVWWAMPSSETMAARAHRLRGTPAEAALHDLIALADSLAPPENASPR